MAGQSERLSPDRILYEDNHLLVVDKPAGLLVQADRTGDPDLLSLAKAYLKEKYHKPGNVYLGLVHRLDRPVSGVVVLARTSKAAARLSAQIRERSPGKLYAALVEGRPPESGRWQDRMQRQGATSHIDPRGKEACLVFRRLASQRQCSYMEIELLTGRHHQIRLQFASRGFPLLGDRRYGGRLDFDGGIALHAKSFTLRHPISGLEMIFSCPLPRYWVPWLLEAQ